ncbi:hypothetical protein SLEP1_g126 [Rubroshorea leprosula]|uniref:RING-type domain-containing protein n=1 Tax=Rubroshorea leprosula TaxID=152421 RepID=A0AAV5H9C5_9ROSI|nr:hypothetical protein SLEP1_g126 [Rubroshorea leprosula]
MAATPAASSSLTDNCPICWDELSTDCGRTIVTLQCSHKFHLDCIGSTFNSFGEMRCPLCRATESGTWIIPGQGADEEASEEDYSDTEGLEFEEWDLFPMQEGLMDPTRAFLYRASSQPAVLATDDGTLYHQVSAFDIIHQLNCQWNQPPLTAFNSIFNHFSTATQRPTSVASSTLRTSPGRSQGVVNIESFIEPVILEPGRSNGPTPCNFDWTCPPINSPSPGVHAMMSSRSGSNGLSETIPTDNTALQSEQTQFNVPSNAPVDRQHQELPIIVQHETNNISPSENSPDDIDPSLKLMRRRKRKSSNSHGRNLLNDLLNGKLHRKNIKKTSLKTSMDDPLGMDKGGEVEALRD